MGKIAIEEHWGSPETEALRRSWLERIGLPLTSEKGARQRTLEKMWEFERRLAVMDAQGIELQVLSLSSPGVQGLDSPEKAMEWAVWLNDRQAALIAGYPDRFRGFANLPLQAPEDAARELERCVEEHGFVGAMVHGHCNGAYLDERRFDPLWEAAQRLQVPLYLHVNEPDPDQMRIYDGVPALLGPTWCWGVETATHALRVVFGGVFDRFPGARLILGHMGEGLPYLLGRLEEGYRIVRGDAPDILRQPPSYYIRENIYITTSGGYRPETMTCALSAVGEDHILFAADYPFADTAREISQVEACALTKFQREKIYRENAVRLFGGLS